MTVESAQIVELTSAHCEVTETANNAGDQSSSSARRESVDSYWRIFLSSVAKSCLGVNI